MAILIIEDDEHIRRLMQINLHARGFEVIEASSIQQGLEQLRCPDLPAAMILDLKLPDGSGWEMLGQIREDPRLSSIPIIIITALMGEVEQDAPGLNIAARLLKPIHAQQLMVAVGYALRTDQLPE